MTSESYQLGPLKQGSGAVFFHSQTAKAVLPPKTLSLAGQTVIITGANVGLGRAGAEWFLELGLSRLILAVRTPSKGEAVAKEMRVAYPKATIDVWQIDMLSYDSIQKFADKCSRLGRLDIAILNAGATAQVFQPTPQGHEQLLQVNYLSTALLAFLLLPTLKAKSPAGKPGRLTIVASGTCYFTKLPQMQKPSIIKAFDDPAAFDVIDQYGASKALIHFWIMKLVEVVDRKDVTVNLVDPGLCKGTSLHRDLSGPGKMVLTLMKSFMGRTMRNGSSNYVYAAVTRGEDSHGSFLMDWKAMPYPTGAYGPEGKVLADKLWGETLAELKFANIERLLNSL